MKSEQDFAAAAKCWLSRRRLQAPLLLSLSALLLYHSADTAFRSDASGQELMLANQVSSDLPHYVAAVQHFATA